MHEWRGAWKVSIDGSPTTYVTEKEAVLAYDRHVCVLKDVTEVHYKWTYDGETGAQKEERNEGWKHHSAIVRSRLDGKAAAAAEVPFPPCPGPGTGSCPTNSLAFRRSGGQCKAWCV